MERMHSSNENVFKQYNAYKCIKIKRKRCYWLADFMQKSWNCVWENEERRYFGIPNLSRWYYLRKLKMKIRMQKWKCYAVIKLKFKTNHLSYKTTSIYWSQLQKHGYGNGNGSFLLKKTSRLQNIHFPVSIPKLAFLPPFPNFYIYWYLLIFICWQDKAMHSREKFQASRA